MKKRLPIICLLLIFAFFPLKTIFAAAPQNFSFTYGSQTFKVPADVLNSWQGQQTLEPNPALNSPPLPFNAYLQNYLGQPAQQQDLTLSYDYDLGKIYSYVQNVASSSQLNIPVSEPDLEIVDNRVATFTPAQIGSVVDVFQSSLAAMRALELGKPSSELIVYNIDPEKSLSDTNTLGINELVAEGVSKFNGSPKNRRWNIAVGVEKMKGILLPQGATFSFDDNLGPVDGEHGFLPELVIDNGTTLPEFGGGLCQVSTTTFRAAMAAGLPITDRRNHAYAVSYYSPQGTDATIYPGSADLKFVNNTPATILIWPYEKDANTLVFDFYGTKDDRQVTLEKPVVFDRQPDGSMKASWTRIVVLNGETSTSTFKSVYQSPALFHKTETFVSATGTPLTGLKIPPAKTN
jgi:vancomycin resistance protein YoaR